MAKTTPKADTTRHTLRDRAQEQYASARERAIDTYESAREKASQARADTREQIGNNPMAALGAGLAVGALIGALIPRTSAEKRALAGVGEKLHDRASEAVSAAKDAGMQQLSDLNLTRDAGEKALSSVIKGVGEAARSASQAAIGTVRGEA